MPEFRLGIIGGCLSHQPGIPISQLYHQQVAQRFKSDENLELKVRLGRGFDLSYPERLRELLARAPLDGILLHSRVVFARKTGLLVYSETNGMRSYVLHPFLFNRQLHGEWMKLEREQFQRLPVLVRQKAPENYAFAEPLPGARVGGFRLNRLNQIFGSWLGLDNWAIADELYELRAFQRACAAEQLPFLVMGPTPSGNSTQLVEKMDRALQANLPRWGIPYCSLATSPQAQGNPIQFGDGTHLTVEGHRFVAERLSPLLAPWAKAILSTKSS